MSIRIRPARLDDTNAISELLRSRIKRWQRFTEAGAVEDCNYAALKIAERWLHGGAWMSVETAAIYLSQILVGAGLAIVAERKGRIIGYLEAFRSLEQEPFGDHWGISSFIVRKDAASSNTIERDLLDHLRQFAAEEQPARILITGIHPVAENWYEQMGFSRISVARRYRLPTQGGRVFYRAMAQEDEDPAQIAGWEMAIGRFSNSRSEWERWWQKKWDVLVVQDDLRTDRLQLSIAGQQALVCARQEAYHRQCVDISLWTMKPLSIQLIIALREWAYRQRYREIQMLIDEGYQNLLDENTESDGYFLETYALKDGDGHMQRA